LQLIEQEDHLQYQRCKVEQYLQALVKQEKKPNKEQPLLQQLKHQHKPTLENLLRYDQQQHL